MTPNSIEELARATLDKAYDSILEEDSIISVTERGLLKAIAEAIQTYGESMRREALEELFADICPYCADKELGYPELHEGRYHTKAGVSPSWENIRCSAADLRTRASVLRTRLTQSRGGE